MATAKERSLEVEGKTKPKKSNATMRCTINGVPIVVDAATMTIRENYRAGILLEEAGFPSTSHFRSAAVVLIVAQRTHPDLTFDDVIDSLTIGDLAAVGEEDVDSPGV